MNNYTGVQKVLYFFLTKIVIGIALVVSAVVLMEQVGRFLLDKTPLTENSKDIIVAVSDAAIALLLYVLLYKSFEKRQIKELSFSTFGRNAITGLFTGLAFQSFFVLVIYLAGDYHVINVNPVSFLVPAFNAAIAAGFVAEILIIGIFFRLTEEKLGTIITLLILTLLFALLHLNVTGATALSVVSTAVEAGFFISAAYIFSRSLWFVIFFHFGWDFAEPGIFGGINPGISIDKSLLTSKFTGSVYLTGGQSGPQNSIQALILCSLAGLLFLWLAKRKNNFLKPYWEK